MKTMRMAAVLAVMALSAVAGCTEGAGAAANSSEIGSKSSPITFQTRSDLPECNNLTADLYAYVEDEHVELGCADGEWAAPIQPI